MISSLLYELNHAKPWQRKVNVWGLNMRAASLDRLAFLSLHRLGLMGQAEDRLLRKLVHPGMQIVDVGANIGLYSLLLARLTGNAGHVYSFEPEPNLFATFSENCAANKMPNITPFQCAAGSATRRAAFSRSAFNSGNNSVTPSSVAAVEVQIVRVEDLLPIQAVDFVKIDVQGHELPALRGMERLLKASDAVRVMFEFWPAGLRRAKTEPDALLGYLSDLGFIIYSTEDSKLTEVTDSAKLTEALGGTRYTNLLASRTRVFTS